MELELDLLELLPIRSVVTPVLKLIIRGIILAARNTSRPSNKTNFVMKIGNQLRLF